MDTRERYKNRKKKMEKVGSKVANRNHVDQEAIGELMNSKVDECLIAKTTELVENHYKFEYDFSVSENEAQEFLDRFKEEFNQERFDKLINDCKREIINSITTPFGLGKILAAYDKTGGNVDTIHNAREGIYATDKEAAAFENRGEYSSDDYHKDPNYIAINREHSESRKKGESVDYMTGEKLDPNQSNDLDHVKSAKEIHDDAGRVLAEIDGKDLANTESNLKPTTSTNNRSKKADSMEDFIARKNNRLQKIEELKSKKDLSQSEQNELRKLEELKKIDDEKALQADKEARQKIDKDINKTYYTSGKFAKEVLKTGAQEGVKMGIQQALGLVIVEFFSALFDEIIDIYKNSFAHGFDDESFIKILKERIKRIGKKIKEKWKDVAAVFKDGAISGFISNLVTTAINAFVTTGKRLVRIIREGIFSLFRAIKMLLFPPEEMTYEEAMHEAKKLIASGVIISLGVIIEEYVDTLIKTTVVLEPFADILTAVFVGSLTGLAVTMTVYYLDKKKNDKDAMKEMISQTHAKLETVEKLYEELQNMQTYLLPPNEKIQVQGG